MKKFILQFNVRDLKNFLEVKEGLKMIETRAATPKYRAVEVGDVLVFKCGARRLEKEVKQVHIFKSIGAMLKALPRTKIMPSTKSVAEMRDAYYGYHNYHEKLKKYGIIAFTII